MTPPPPFKRFPGCMCVPSVSNLRFDPSTLGSSGRPGGRCVTPAVRGCPCSGRARGSRPEAVGATVACANRSSSGGGSAAGVYGQMGQPDTELVADQECEAVSARPHCSHPPPVAQAFCLMCGTCIGTVAAVPPSR